MWLAPAPSRLLTPFVLYAVLCAVCRLFPAFQNIRAISKVLTAHVGQHMVEVGLGTTPDGCTDWEEFVASNMWTADQL